MDVDYKMASVIIVVCILLFFWRQLTYKVFEGFNNKEEYRKWSPDLIKRFNEFQTTVNENNYQYDMETIQQQAPPEEAEELLKTGYWPWSDELKGLYIEKMWSNTMIKADPNVALRIAMKTYNQRAMTELIAWNSKEGEFLLNGVIIKKNPNINGTNNDTIKCSYNDVPVLEKKTFKGINLWNGYKNIETTILSPEDIPKEVPGFRFASKKCNPCVAINGDFSCPFSIATTTDKNDEISSPWRMLWS